jgi:hypothetical protein
MKIKCLVVALGLCVSQVGFSQADMGHKRMPVFTPFNWNTTAPDGYIIKGTVCNHISGLPQQPACGPVTFVIDPPNKRLLFDLGAAGGQNYIINDASYVTGVVPGVCLKVNNFTWDDQVAGYLNVLSMTDNGTNVTRYFGRADDVASCQDRIGTELFTKFILGNGVLTQYNFSQLYPFPGLGCAYVTGKITFDLKTLDFDSPRDPYFAALPANCTSAAPDYCSAAYPPGNPCSNLTH